MDQADPNARRRKGTPGRLSARLALAAATGAGVITIAAIASPTTVATADPVAPPAPTTAAPASPNPAPAATAPPADPNAASAPAPADPTVAPAPADPTVAPAPAEPNAAAPAPADPSAGRMGNSVGGFSYVMPAGWTESDSTHLDYGSALLSKLIGEAVPGQAPPVANDTRIVLGRLDQKLYASAEADNSKAAARLASDMGEFFMPYPGTRINQATIPLNANGMTGTASYYEVKFSDPAKPNGQIWAGVVGSPAAGAANSAAPQRWFVVWLGTANDPVDQAAAKALAESVRPWTPMLEVPTPVPATPPAPPAPAAPAAPGVGLAPPPAAPPPPPAAA